MHHILALLVAIWVSGLLSAKDTAAKNDKAWPVVCVDKSDAKTCRTSMTKYVAKVADPKKHKLGKVLELTVLYRVNPETKKRMPYLSVQLPLGVNITTGAIIQVDNNKQIKLPFLQCLRAGCDASTELSPKLLRSILAGIKIKTIFVLWGETKYLGVTTSLTGFTRSFRKLK